MNRKDILTAHLNKIFEEKSFPGVSVCIRGPEGIIYEHGFGHIDMAKSRKINKDTIMGIASMSKSMTALACAILQAEGKLNFSDPVTDYFPQFRIPGTPRESVTLRHLAMHTAGVPPIAPLEWSIVMNTPGRDTEYERELRKSAPNKMDTIEDIIDFIANSGAYEPLGAPGEYMSYSNDAYAILSYVVDKAAGQSLESFLDERIFKPLGMTRTVLDLDGSEANKLGSDGNITELFEKDEEGNLYSDREWSVLPPFRGCACVKSTADDMAKYYLMIAQNGIFKGKRIIPAEAVEILIGREFPERQRPFYCFGLNKRLMAGRVLCEHAGGLHGVSTNGGLIRSEDELSGYGLAVLCNESEVSTEDMFYACYNLVLGLDIDLIHRWFIPSGKKFLDPEMIVGKYICREANPVYNIVTLTDDFELHAEYQGEPLELHLCYGTLFSARTKEDPDTNYTSMEFLVRDGKAWGVRCGTRIYQRFEE